MAKSISVGNAARNGLAAALLAEQGFTGRILDVQTDRALIYDDLASPRTIRIVNRTTNASETIWTAPTPQHHPIRGFLMPAGALLEVSQPRIPCHKLALRHQRADLPKHFLASGRSGFYFRIARAGEVAAGDAIERVAADPQRLSVAEVQSLARGAGDPELVRRAAEHPALAQVWREDLRRRLGGLRASG